MKNANVPGVISSASMHRHSWRFYDQNRTLPWQFFFSRNTDLNATWVAVLGGDGMITFSNLLSISNSISPIRIPIDPCGNPEACDSYMVYHSSSSCQCVPALSSRHSRVPGTSPARNLKKDPDAGKMDLVTTGDGTMYPVLAFVPPRMKSDLINCRRSCLGNCSCLALFFTNSLGNCFSFETIGSPQISASNTSGSIMYIKVLSSGRNDEKNGLPYILAIAFLAT